MHLEFIFSFGDLEIPPMSEDQHRMAPVFIVFLLDHKLCGSQQGEMNLGSRCSPEMFSIPIQPMCIPLWLKTKISSIASSPGCVSLVQSSNRCWERLTLPTFVHMNRGIGSGLGMI